eukprot:jgi/Hompol1/3043/HPOL_003093-RA
MTQQCKHKHKHQHQHHSHHHHPGLTGSSGASGASGGSSAVVASVVQALAHATAEFERRLRRVDFIAFAAQDIPAALSRHLRDVRLCVERLGSAYAGGRSLPLLFHGLQPHVALDAPLAEIEYLRRISDILLACLLPESELKCESLRYLLREIVATRVLGMLVDVLSDPDYLNQLLLRIFEADEPVDESPPPEPSNDAVETYSDGHAGHADHADLNDGSVLSFDNTHSEGYSIATSDDNDNHDDDDDQLEARQDSQHSPFSDDAIPLQPHDDLSHADSAHAPLFNIRATNNPFVRKRKKTIQVVHGATGPAPASASNPFVKFTMGGIERVTNSLDKIKSLVAREPSETRKPRQARAMLSQLRLQRRKQKALENDREFEGLSPIESRSTMSFAADSADISAIKPSVSPQRERDQSPVRQAVSKQQQQQQHRSTQPTHLHQSNLHTSSSLKPAISPLSNLPETTSRDTSRLPKLHFEDQDGQDIAAHESDPALQATESTESWLFTQAKEIWKFLWSLYHETRSGPWKLGPIDTTKYDRQYLDEPFVELLDEAFQIQAEEPWIYTQVMFFVKPIVHFIGSPFINRLVMKGVYALICEEQIVNYLLAFRISFWPNNYPALNYGVRSEREKLKTRALLEAHLINTLSRKSLGGGTLNMGVLTPRKISVH